MGRVNDLKFDEISSDEDETTNRHVLNLGDGEDSTEIKIDEGYAKRYEYNKKREELDRFKTAVRQGLIDPSDSDSEEEELIKPSKKTEAEFFDALIKVRNRDPILREKDAKLFNSDDEDEDGEDNASKKEGTKKKKPMYLKDVVSEQLIAAGPEVSDEEEENRYDDGARNRVKTYSEEQEERRQKLLRSLEEGENDDGDGDLLRVKSSGKDEDEEDEEDDDVFVEKVAEFFGEDEKLDNDSKFLKDYFEKRRWLEEGKGDGAGDVDVDLSEDEEAVEDQEDYERACNFRHEENAGDRVMSYSRKVEGSVRKKDNARKSQRERREERRVQAEFEKKEELKRMKNLKKKEINEKLEKIREVAGIGKDKGVFLDTDDLEEEFDPEAHDRKMKEAFGDDYYGAEDVDPQFGSDEDEDEGDLEKPDFDKEDELLGLSKGWDGVDKSSEGFKSARERIMKGKVVKGDEDVVVEEDGGEERKEGSKRKRKRKQSDVEKAVMEELLDEYYKLDYEDTIGDLKTRFKYRPVKAKKFGLNAAEILALDDKELNQYVSLKKIATYREKEWEVPRSKTIQVKESLYKKVNTSRSVDGDKKGKHHEGKAKEEEVNPVESEEPQPKESNGEKETVSRKRRRKENQAELKLPEGRLRAYGKIPSKSKSKKQK